MHEETSKSGDFRGRFLKVFTPAKSLVVLHVLMSSRHVTERHRWKTVGQRAKKVIPTRIEHFGMHCNALHRLRFSLFKFFS